MKPKDAIKKRQVTATYDKDVKVATALRRVGTLEIGDKVRIPARYELIGGPRRRATDPVWTDDVYTIALIDNHEGNPTLYTVKNQSGKIYGRRFTAAQLLKIGSASAEKPPVHVGRDSDDTPSHASDEVIAGASGGADRRSTRPKLRSRRARVIRKPCRYR